MKVKLIGKSQIINLILPQRVLGNYWISNENKENLINVEASNNKWIIKSNDDVKIMGEGNSYLDSVELESEKFYYFHDVTNGEIYRAFTSDTYDSSMMYLDFIENTDITFNIGNSSNPTGGNPNYFSYDYPSLTFNQLQIIRKGGLYEVRNLNPKVNLYVNDFVTNGTYLKFGDMLFIEGLTFTFIGNSLLLGNVNDKVRFDNNKFRLHPKTKLDYGNIENLPDSGVELYTKDDYFVRPPRFNQVIESKDFYVDDPPKPTPIEDTPMILTLGPMLVMGMSSAVTGGIAIIKVITKAETLKENLTSILTAVCMLTAMIVFPSITRAYNKHKLKKREKLRDVKYRQYLDDLGKQISEECTRQKRILIENNVNLKDTGDVILFRKRNLWERKVTHDDFLELRLGTGNVTPKININFSEEHFKLKEDELENVAREVIEKNKIITEVPVTHNFRDRSVTALIGKIEILRRFVDGLLLQMMAYHSYDELKLVIFTSKKNAKSWKKLQNSPYLWDDDKTIRFYATTPDEISRIGSELEIEFTNRSQINNGGSDKIFYPHYVIITDDIESVSKVNVINSILKSSNTVGFSIIYLTEKLNDLPSECSSFISIDANVGGIFENELINQKQQFVPDFTTVEIDNYIYSASNIPIERNSAGFELPNVYSFLEMYNAGNVHQLNAFNLWRENDPTTSLSCPVGVDTNGDLFKLDLHEKVHGPHGLVAGMTGSGKSEFIITYILSMAVNYHPNEVQFVLIDYKGGGLAGAFENKETGLKLPHLAGSITNLDAGEIKRSLSSLQSELKRRQRVFNEARDLNNESTIDIYKYQKLYREGKVSEPVAHLFIISDEFAELKAQQPDFMDELISTARIGRSLGVHLILATQKPSGVVDDQIWSNSKFRVCLKVQDKNDSMDMLKNPDAAYLKETGRFYLQVGFNEFFAKGQSAWCGAPYYESEKRKKYVDNSIAFVNDIGSRIKNIDNPKNNAKGVHKGDEITNILSYLAEIGRNENINVKKLWLEQMPAVILVNNLKLKYNFERRNYDIDIVIGEYDVPMEQRQSLLSLHLYDTGNILLFGAVGSGKENLISTIIYSLVSTYTSEEFNLYILDFGSEALRMYQNANQVGGYVGSTEKDRIATLINMLRKKIEERKKLFSEYGGNYASYVKKSSVKAPVLITIVNGFESFNETYTDFAEDFIYLTREGVKYGIYFIVTVSAQNNIRSKVSQNFNEKLVLQMNDSFDYRSLLGRCEVEPSKIMGRGLCKRNGIYEFQSAYPAEEEELIDFVNNTILECNNISPSKAERIPSLPEVVSTQFLAPEFEGMGKVPIGVAKQSLNILSLDLKSQPAVLVSASKLANTKDFLTAFIYELSTLENTGVFVIDAEKLITDQFDNVKYFNNSYAKVFESFKKTVDELNDIYVKSDYDVSSLDKFGDMIFVITGINKLKTIIGKDYDLLVGDTMMTAKKLSKICFIVADTFDNLKKIEYDLWYKDIVNSTRGIWIGNGLAEQSVFKLSSSSSKNIGAQIPNGFGYNIVSGNPTLFKYVDTYGTDENNER